MPASAGIAAGSCLAGLCGGCLSGITKGKATVMATVEPDQLAAQEFLGKFKRIMYPGLHFVLPGTTVRHISTRVMENQVLTETKTKDNVFVKIQIAVQQEVHRENAYQAIYRLTNASEQIDSFVADVVRSHVPRTNLDDLYVQQDHIAIEVKARLTEAMSAYGYSIRQVLIKSIEPDSDVQRAMNEIEASKRDRQAAQEKAEANKIAIVKEAEAEGESKFLQGQGIARSRAAIVEGLRDAVNSKGGGKNALNAKQVSELLLMTQYFDTMEGMSKNQAKTIFVPQSSDAATRNAMMQASSILG